MSRRSNMTIEEKIKEQQKSNRQIWQEPSRFGYFTDIFWSCFYSLLNQIDIPMNDRRIRKSFGDGE